MSHLTQSMVEQFFELEKESARGVLRKEMDSAMDTIFKQMKQKLMMLVESGCGENETGHELAHLGEPTVREEQFYESSNDTSHIPTAPTNFQAQFSDMSASNLFQHDGFGDRVQHEQIYSSSNQILSTSTNPQAQLNVLDVSNLSQIDQINVNSPIDKCDNCDKSTNESMPSTSIQSKYSNAQFNDNLLKCHVPGDASLQDDDEIVIKNELGEIVNIISNEPIQTDSTLFQPSNDIENLFDEVEEEEEEGDCDCPECVGDLCVVKEESDDDDVQIIEDPGESNVSNPKRARLENDHSQVVAQVQIEPNKPAFSNRYITVGLKCPQCPQMCDDRHALNGHMKSVHSIERFRCLYKDCNRSFDKLNHFGHHIRTAHSTQPNSTWPCGHCSEHFKNSKSLFTHNLRHHQEGQFQCSQLDCQFVGQLKQSVINHFKINHKLTTKAFTPKVFENPKAFVCQFPGCERKFQYSSDLKTHERTHRSAKPYRCKLPDCTYDSGYKGDTLRHIGMHLKKVRKQNNQFKNMSDDPYDYFEVVQELL